MDRNAEFVAAILSWKDPDLAGHHQRLGTTISNFALQLGYSPGESALLESGARIHDIGKIAISDHVLNKSSRLTPSELVLIKQHTTIGFEMIQSLGLDPRVAETVLHHHENFDGTGYPAGIGGQEIPLFPRIMRICDSFDALMMDRPYHQGVSRETALEILKRDQQMYDPELLNEFVGMMENLQRTGAWEQRKEDRSHQE